LPEQIKWLSAFWQARAAGARKGGFAMFFFQEGFTYRNFLMDALAIFIFIVWFWLLITVFADLFRRHDISGWIKAIWVIALIVFPYIAVLAYLIFQGRGMAERNVQARDELRSVVGFSVADEIQKLDGLKRAGSISDAEFARLRARLVQ
jgi:hypothetical protein